MKPVVVTLSSKVFSMIAVAFTPLGVILKDTKGADKNGG